MHPFQQSPDETWKYCKELNGLGTYYVSNYGRVIKFVRPLLRGRGKYPAIVEQPKKGKSGKHKYHFIHRLVWNLFSKYPSADTKIPVHHKDGSKTNNHIDNLEMMYPADHLRNHYIEDQTVKQILTNHRDIVIKLCKQFR